MGRLVNGNGAAPAPPVNARGHLEIGGCDAVELARRYGTPLYVIDEEVLRATCREYVRAMAEAYPGSTAVVYAGKAFLTTGMCRIVEQEGLYLDVCSGGELYTALTAHYPPERLVMHGNNKSPDELAMALEAGVGLIVVDNAYELALLDRLARRQGRRCPILLRLTPGVEAHTHSYIQTGQLDSKFGFPLAEGVALGAVRDALARDGVELRGFHCHIGSQVFDLESFQVAARLMFDFIRAARDETGFVPGDLNMGGGLGIRHHGGEPHVPLAEYARALGEAVAREAERSRIPLPRLMVEPGRSIIGPAGWTLYTVGSIKDVPGIRRYVAVDGGMGDNPRVALYQAVYEATVANKAARERTEVVSVAGKCCETGDMLIWDARLQPVEPGDILAVHATGAYNYSMASNYNRLPRPAVVLVGYGRSDVLVRRETYEDLVRFDVIPERLAKPVSRGQAAGRAAGDD